MWFIIFIVLLNIGIGFGFAYYLKLRHKKLYMDSSEEGVEGEIISEEEAVISEEDDEK